MLIWTNYVVAERGSVTDAECDKYCHCRNCQTNITHKHTHTQTHMCITTYAFAQLPTDKNTHTFTQVQMCACLRRAFTNHSGAGDGLPPPNRHTGFNNEVQISLFADTFSAFLPLSFVLLVKNAHKPDREIKRENIPSFFWFSVLKMAKFFSLWNFKNWAYSH